MKSSQTNRCTIDYNYNEITTSSKANIIYIMLILKMLNLRKGFTILLQEKLDKNTNIKHSIKRVLGN